MMLTRIPIFAVVAAAIGWLVWDGAPLERRAAAINRALERGDLGGLTATETKRVQNLLEQLVAASGLALPVALNKPLQPGADRIRVFTSRPAAREVSKTARGNAVYDAHVDAIFIDLDIVAPAVVNTMYADIRVSDQPEESRTYDYLAFVFLHELGHRALHRNRGQLLDAVLLRGDKEAQRYEREADEFALRALRTHYQKTDTIGTYTGPRLRVQSFEDELAEMVDTIVRSLLFSAVPYSPFYSDAAHPTFLSRTLGFLETKSAAEGDVPHHLRLVQQQLLRIADVANRPYLEIQVPGAIAGLGAVPNGLSITTADGKAYFVSSTTLSASDVAGGIRRVAATEATSEPPRADRSHANETKASPTSRIPGGSFLQGTNLFLPVELPERTAPESPPIPARSPRLFIAAVLKVAGVQASEAELDRATRQFTGALQTSGLPGEIGFILLGVAERRAHALVLPLDRSAERILGAATVDLDNFSTIRLERLKLQWPEQRAPYHAKFHTVPRADGGDHYLIGHHWRSTGPEDTGAEICLWKITAEPPRLIACHPLIAAAVPGWKSGQGWPGGTVVLMRTGWSAPAHLAADLHGDSVYAFDLATGKARILFHPGGLQIVVLPSGHVVLYAAGSHKAFAVKP